MNPDVARVRLHVVTDDDVLTRDGWVEAAASVMEVGGGDVAIHLRGPRLPGAELYRLAERLVAIASDSGAAVVVNDRIDVALAVPVAGIHLGRRSLSVAMARRLVAGPADRQMTVGVSCHTAEEVDEAASVGADYVFMGAVHGTPSHPGRAVIGLQGLREACSPGRRLPVVGIGGVTPERVDAIVASGAHGVAVIRGIWDRGRPDLAVSTYLSALSNAFRD